MPFPRGILSVLVLGVLATSAPSQDLFARTYTEAGGLPSSKVLDIRQGPSGRMWFATRTGVFEYDGTSWHPRLAPAVFPGREVQFVRFDAAGQPWVLCTDGGVVSPALEARLPPIRFQEAGLLRDFAVHGAGARVEVCAVSVNRGLQVGAGTAWRSPDLAGAETGVVTVESCFGRLFAGSPRGLHVLPAGDAPPPWVTGLPAGPVWGLSRAPNADGTEELWILGRGWLGVARDEEFTLLAEGLPRVPIPSDTRVALVPDGANGAVFGSTSTIFHLHGSTGDVRQLGHRTGLGVSGVNALNRDRDGHIWGASDTGAFKIPFMDAAMFTQTHGLPTAEVSALAELSDGRIVAGHVAALTVIAKDGLRPIPFAAVPNRPPAFSRVNDLCVDKHDQLIIAAAGRGVGRLRPDHTIDWTAVPASAGAWANAIRCDGDGGYFVGTPRGLRRLIDGRFAPVAGAPPDRPYIRRITLGDDGTVYCATPDGILIGNGTRWRTLRPRDTDKTFIHFFTCFEDRSGRVWCGGTGGLFRVQNQRLVRPESAYDLRRQVFSITEDLTGRLWIGTARGFHTAHAFGLESLEWLAPQTGFEANRAAAITTRQGAIWLGTTHGVSRFEKSFDVRVEPPRTRLLGVGVGTATVPRDEEIRLDTGQSNLTFRVEALSYLDESQITLRSRIDGFSDWELSVGSTVRELKFTGLPPGVYRFEVQARAPTTGFGPIASSGAIHVLGPIWTRWWFLAALFLTSTGLAIGLYRTFLLRRQATRLEVEVADRTAALQTSLEELAKTDRLRSLGLIGGGIAHDLRNLLTVLTGNFALLEEKLRDVEGASELLAAADGALDRATSLSQQLQTFATGGAPVKSATALTELIKDSAQILLAGAPVTLEMEFDEDLWPAEIDAIQIRQVVENLLVNARQCQPSGGFIRIEGHNLTVEGQTHDAPGLPPGRYVAFTITDGGPGIEADVGARIFDPFFTTKAEGSGLGLATALSIVRRHGGSLSHAPAPHGGAAFRLLLPATSSTPAATEPAGPRPAELVGTSILVVDDEPGICTILCTMLEHFGFDAWSASDSAAALREAAAREAAGEPFRIAILDMTLPGDLPGPEILAQLRQISPTIRAIASSGYSEYDGLAVHEDRGFQAALPKPYRTADLERALRAVTGADSGDRFDRGSRAS